jgi:hypothetical protein
MRLRREAKRYNPPRHVRHPPGPGSLGCSSRVAGSKSLIVVPNDEIDKAIPSRLLREVTYSLADEVSAAGKSSVLRARASRNIGQTL